MLNVPETILGYPGSVSTGVVVTTHLSLILTELWGK